MSSNTLRIIAGQWRGRKLKFTPTPNLRPTPDRVRETVFNWLSAYLPGANCLDLFAGSGALAWEALSRGAQHVTLIDNNLQAIKTLKEHQQLLNCQSQSTIIQANALNVLIPPFEKGGLGGISSSPPFDIIFIDAPFRQNLVKPSLELIEKHGLLKKDGCIYVEMEKEESLQLPSSLTAIKHKIAGQLQFMLLESV